jgi:hypothetical protein
MNSRRSVFYLCTAVAPHSDHFMNQTVTKQRNSSEHTPLSHYKIGLWSPANQIIDREERRKSYEKDFIYTSDETAAGTDNESRITRRRTPACVMLQWWWCGGVEMAPFCTAICNWKERCATSVTDRFHNHPQSAQLCFKMNWLHLTVVEMFWSRMYHGKKTHTHTSKHGFVTLASRLRMLLYRHMGTVNKWSLRRVRIPTAVVYPYGDY